MLVTSSVQRSKRATKNPGKETFANMEKRSTDADSVEVLCYIIVIVAIHNSLQPHIIQH